MPDGLRAQVEHAFGAAFMDGFHLALMIGGLVLLTAAAVAYRWIPAEAHVRDGHPATAEMEAVAEL